MWKSEIVYKSLPERRKIKPEHDYTFESGSGYGFVYFVYMVGALTITIIIGIIILSLLFSLKNL